MGDATACQDSDPEFSRIPLGGRHGRGLFALVDTADLPLVHRYSWHVWVRNTPNRRTNGPYALAKISGRQVYMHKLITGWDRTDHHNHNGLDNRRSNLRDSSAKQNSHNMRPYLFGSSTFKGVSKTNQGKWSVKIWVDGRGVLVGTFADEVGAAHAYDQAARMYHGEFAYLNFPE